MTAVEGEATGQTVGPQQSSKSDGVKLVLSSSRKQPRKKT